MDTQKDLANARWRKSSYSGNTGGECIECAPLGHAAWRKSSYSGTSGGDCVEIAQLPTRIALRDSKTPEAGAFTASPGAFAAFVRAASDGQFG
ncbi:DUF397 domain-containing protein [Streptomyces sp. B-S-A8]|uniref:DUF397 domain-containing protein n=1 Tax=Streptomyces solicavernae TaxID=3043614 RepID=A0ABT6S286_9ACTN|nr:DUF397 domain-containing protein [Streptomyces sp. B-S-A8]MDI3390805.1 DUF397 domain-containing protein [Streptomyces sp. B-S-A8]